MNFLNKYLVFNLRNTSNWFDFSLYKKSYKHAEQASYFL
jgi:hypothetical protein